MDKTTINNGMCHITNGQKYLLKKLLDVVVEIENETHRDKLFKRFVYELGIFELNELKNFEEIKSVLEDNIYGPFM